MFSHPHITSELARYRQQEMIAQARQRRQAAQLHALSRDSRPAGGLAGNSAATC